MKKNIVGILLFTVVIFTSNLVKAQPAEAPAQQSAPIPLEIFLGTDGWTSQLIIDKKLAAGSKFGFFGLSYLKADYDNAEFLRESINLAFLKYDLFKGVSLLSGAVFNSHWGFRPYAGAQYAYHSKNFMGVINSGFHLTETQNFESLAIVEYRPPIKGAWSLYTHIQGIYSQNTEISKHDRSFLYSRLGLSYKSFSFGAAFNYDCYGPTKIEDQQWGIFISTVLK
ncbi:hypothetical protein [Maribellus maritimus]|uniref:hypothetical protein n=1 Tax=Maribellus maritimus TaxID=2870838 RepID=UPI001EEC2708|nr:hypothetical protein [Maribellus maritimus]MCG6189519.1 hypothetical protein [Maribellus maritimus]